MRRFVTANGAVSQAVATMLTIVVIAGCSSAENTGRQATTVVATSIMVPTTPPVTNWVDDETVTQRIDYSLAVAAYAPFNQDGQDGIGPFFFGSDDTSRQAGFACYEQRLSELIDFSALRVEAIDVVGGYFNVPAEDASSARRAAADCISAEGYRLNWIHAHVWGWNTYGRAQSQPALEPTDQCFAPVYDTPEDFVDAVVAGELDQGDLAAGSIGPFLCVDPAG